ncbi:transposon Tf2-9 polyprotein [Trichonephila clavipes]|nr:transposon Tf2-9 polyprotein [Trichonephila clavipes]
MEEKQNCIQTPVNKGTAQFCYKKQKMESYIRLLHVEKTNTAEEKYDSYELEKTMQKRELITRIARWALQLEEFDYEIEHRAGSPMKHVDALSRYPVMMVCNDTLTSKLKNAQEEDDNIQTLKSLLEKQESEEFLSEMTHLPNLLGYIPSKLCRLKAPSKNQKQQQKTFGNPIRIISDRGSAFTSKLFNDYCDEENIQHLQIAAGVPRGNGQVERIHRTLIPVLTKLSLDDSTKWYKYVDRLQRILNSTISRSTKWTPFELLVGIEMRNKEDILIKDLLLEEMAKELLEQREFLRSDAKKNIETLQSELERRITEEERKLRIQKEGDLVAIQRTQFGAGLKLRPKFLGPYKVTKVNSKDRYEVEKVGQHDGPNSTTISADLMKIFYA